MACLGGVCGIEVGRGETIALSLRTKAGRSTSVPQPSASLRTKPADEVGCKQRPGRKFQKPGTVAVPQRPRAGVKVGREGVLQGQRCSVPQRGLWNWTDLGSSLSSPVCWPGDLGQVKSPLSASVSSSVKWGFFWDLSGGGSSGTE